MATMMTETTATRKPSKEYFTYYYEEAVALTKVGGSLYFVSEAGEMTEVEPDTLNFLTVLGQIQLANRTVGCRLPCASQKDASSPTATLLPVLSATTSVGYCGE